MNKIQDIIEDIKRLEEELLVEIQKKESEFFYKVKGKKVYFEEEAKKYQKTLIVKVQRVYFKIFLVKYNERSIHLVVYNSCCFFRYFSVYLSIRLF